MPCPKMSDLKFRMISSKMDFAWTIADGTRRW